MLFVVILMTFAVFVTTLFLGSEAFASTLEGSQSPLTVSQPQEESPDAAVTDGNSTQQRASSPETAGTNGEEDTLLGSVTGPVGETVGAVAEPVGRTVGSVTEPVGEAAGTVTEPVGQSVEPVTEPVGEAVGAVTEPAGRAVGEISTPAGEALAPAGRALGGVTEPVGQATGRLVEPAGKPVADLAGPVVGAAATPAVEPVLEASDPVTKPLGEVVDQTAGPLVSPVAKAAEPVTGPVRDLTEPVKPVLAPVEESLPAGGTPAPDKGDTPTVPHEEAGDDAVVAPGTPTTGSGRQTDPAPVVNPAAAIGRETKSISPEAERTLPAGSRIAREPDRESAISAATPEVVEPMTEPAVLSLERSQAAAQTGPVAHVARGFGHLHLQDEAVTESGAAPEVSEVGLVSSYAKAFHSLASATAGTLKGTSFGEVTGLESSAGGSEDSSGPELPAIPFEGTPVNSSSTGGSGAGGPLLVLGCLAGGLFLLRRGKPVRNPCSLLGPSFVPLSIMGRPG